MSTKGNRLTELISRQLSNKKKRSGHIVLSQNNIYIFPSAAGMTFVILLTTLLVTAINYQNSLIYLLTFVLGAMFFISIWLCFLNLRGLEVITDTAVDVCEGQSLNFMVTFLQATKSTPSLYYGIDSEHCTEVFIAKGVKRCVNISQAARGRGYYPLDRLFLCTLFPFGLIRAWTWLKTEAGVFVYPAPVEPVYAQGVSQSDLVNHATQVTLENSGDLKSYASGDSLSRIAWKHYAARDELYIRAYDASAGEVDQWVDWLAYKAANIDQRLGMMCWDILRLKRQQKRFGLRLPGLEIAQDSGSSQEQKCLRALAVFER